MWSTILFVLPSIIDMTPVTEPVTYILFVVGLTPMPLLPQPVSISVVAYTMLVETLHVMIIAITSAYSCLFILTNYLLFLTHNIICNSAHRTSSNLAICGIMVKNKN